MILGDIVTEVCGKIGQTDESFKTKIRRAAKLRRDMLWGMVLWKDTLSIYTKAGAAAQHTLFMPSQVELIVAVKNGDQSVFPVDQVYLFNNDPQIWERSGNPLLFSQPPASGVGLAPLPAGERFSLKSNNAGDVGKKVSIYGELNGEEMSEVLTLNGTAAVQTVNLYNEVLNLSKEATAGAVAVSGVTSLASLVSLSPAQREKRHCRLRLHEIPGAAVTLLILAKRNAPPLVNDTDTTGLPSLDNAILAFVMGDGLQHIRQYAKASTMQSEGTALVTEAKKTNVYQEARRTTITPGDSLGDDCPREY